MYSVVGCPECRALKIVEDRPETTRCPRCGRRTKFEKLRKFYQSDEPDAAREIRARLIAERSGHGDAYAELGDFTELATAADEAGVTDEEYLAAEGLDTDSIAEAGARAMSGSGSQTSRKQVVMNAIRDLDRPTEQEIVERAAESGVPAEYARNALDSLAQRGAVTQTDGRYRLL